jgi:hypothetical protein
MQKIRLRPMLQLAAFFAIKAKKKHFSQQSVAAF